MELIQYGPIIVHKNYILNLFLTLSVSNKRIGLRRTTHITREITQNYFNLRINKIFQIRRIRIMKLKVYKKGFKKTSC